jgi:hypothetical protein
MTSVSNMVGPHGKSILQATGWFTYVKINAAMVKTPG